MVVKGKIASPNCPHFPGRIADFGLKYRILGENSKNNISGSTPRLSDEKTRIPVKLNKIRKLLGNRPTIHPEVVTPNHRPTSAPEYPISSPPTDKITSSPDTRSLTGQGKTADRNRI